MNEQGEQKDLDEGPFQTLYPCPKVSEPEPLRTPLSLERRSRHQLQGDAGEMSPEFIEGHAPCALRRVVYHRPASGHLLENHEVVEIPVNDAGQPELASLRQFEAHGPAGHLEFTRQRHDLFQRGAAQRQRVAPAQRGDVHGVSEVARHHRQAGQATLRSFGLIEHGQAQRAGELESSSNSFHFSRPWPVLSDRSAKPVEGLQHPSHQGALFLNDIGVKHHPRL